MSDSRFEILRRLGRGGMGEVDLVRERATGEVLARKRLVRFEPAQIVALKRELRTVGSIVHPNLVRVYELGDDERGPFLLMEAVEGVDVLRYCEGGGPELATVLPQIFSVLAHLHHRGIAHGDVTPANLVVRRDGWVKLIDFGLSAAGDAGSRVRGGTPGYLAPERRDGGPPTAESDVFGLGAVLRHITTGSPPGHPPLRADAPPALERAMEAMLREDPLARPSIDALARDVLPALGLPRNDRGGALGTRRLARAALEGLVLGSVLARPGELVVLRGPSGIGKTTVARAVAARAAEAGISVSWARARPAARVAFNLVDELIDDAAERLSRSALAPAQREAARRASLSFPALARLVGVDPLAERVRRAAHAALFDSPRETASRGPLFAELLSLLEQVDSTAPARIVVLDDLQWADADSLAALSAWLDHGSSRCAFLATARDGRGSKIAGWLAARRGVTQLEVPKLPTEAIAAFLREAGGFDAARADEIARACGGLPVLMEMALRAPQSNDPLRDAADSAIRECERDEKSALARLLAAGRPLSRTEHGASERTLDLLSRRGLALRAGPRVDLAHDALREPLREALGEDWLRTAHDALAEAAAADPDSRHQAERVRHLMGAGRVEQAATLALDAATRAERMHAHDLAADLLEVALRPGHVQELAERRALALERAQRFDDAAAAWADLQRRATDRDERLRLELAEAHALLSGRRIPDGRARLDAALRSATGLRLGSESLGRVITVARFLAGPLPIPLWRTRSPVRAERFLRSATIVGYFDTIAGLELLMRARDDFDERGALEQAAWCDFLLAFFARFADPRGRGVSARYLRAAERRLAGRRINSPIVLAFPSFLRAYGQLRQSDYRAAAEEFERAIQRVTGTPEERSFEAQLALSLRTSAVLASQDVHAADAAVARFERLAHDGVDVAIQCHVETARALVLTWRGRFEEALDAMNRLRAAWPAEPSTIQSILIETYAALPAALLGDGARARTRLQTVLGRGRHFSIFRTAYGPIVAAVAALTELTEHDVSDANRARARRWAKLSASRPSVITGLGHRVLAALDDREGRTDLARARLQLAEREALKLGQAIDAAQARYALALQLHSAELEASARAQLAEVGASPRLLVEHRILRGALGRERPAPSGK